MLELPIPSTFSVEQSAVVGESVGARGRTSNYAYKSENIPYHVLLNKHGARCLHKQRPSRSFPARTGIIFRSHARFKFIIKLYTHSNRSREVRGTHNI